MITTDYKMRTSKILTDYSVEDGFFWSCILHYPRQTGENYSLRVVIFFGKYLIGSENDLVLKISTFFLANNWMNEEGIDVFQRTFLYILMSTMGNISCLKCNYFLESSLCK